MNSSNRPPMFPIVFAAASLLLVPASLAADALTDRPNVILILADDLTGACDTGSLFAGRGPIPVAIWPDEPTRPSVPGGCGETERLRGDRPGGVGGPRGGPDDEQAGGAAAKWPSMMSRRVWGDRGGGPHDERGGVGP